MHCDLEDDGVLLQYRATLSNRRPTISLRQHRRRILAGRAGRSPTAYPRPPYPSPIIGLSQAIGGRLADINNLHVQNELKC